MITIDKARLRELAEKAKQGGYVSESELACALRDPATVLALLDAYEALQAECEKLREQYRKLIELGEDFQWENIIRVDISDFPSRDDAIDTAMREK